MICSAIDMSSTNFRNSQILRPKYKGEDAEGIAPTRDVEEVEDKKQSAEGDRVIET